MSHKRTFMSLRDKKERPSKPVYAPCYDHVDSLSLVSAAVDLHRATFSKAGHLRGGSITFRVLTQNLTPLKISLPDGRSWTVPVHQGENVLKFDCAVKKNTELVFEVGGTLEMEDAFIQYEFAEEIK